MASHHHHCYCSPHATSGNCCYYGCHCTSSHHPHPPSDSLFMHHSTFQPPLSPCHNHPYSSTQQTLPPHRPPQNVNQKERYSQELHQFHPEGGLTQSHPIVASLLRRIASLESALHSHGSSRSYSLRDPAARIIQTYFRAFLARRSRTLRQLKELASIKSALNVLKSAISEDPCFYPRLLTKETSKLLRRLDSVQGDDSMIRDGKMSIVKDLNRFMDSIDGFCLKRSEFSTRLVKKSRRPPMKETNKPRILNTASKLDAESKRVQDVTKRIDALYDKVQGFGEENDEEEEDEDLDSPAISRLRRNKDQDKSKKKVSFAEKGYVYRIPSRHCQDSIGDNYGDEHDPSSSNSMLDDMGWEAVDNNKGKNEEARSDDDEVSCESSDGDGDGDGERSAHLSCENGSKT